MAGSAGATAIAYDQALVNGVLTTTTTYTIDMSSSVIDLLTAEATMSSATPSASTFTDGRVSTGSFTLTSTATLRGASATDTLTVTISSDLAGAAGRDTVTVSSNGPGPLTGAAITLTAEGNTFVFTQGKQWAIGASSGATATNIAAAINNQRYWTASAGSGASLGVVTILCSTSGSRCNDYTLSTSTPTALVAGSASFAGGVDNTYFLINSQMYIQGVDWTADVSFASNTAVAIKNAVNSLDTQGVTASTTSSTVVTLTVTAAGTAGNSFTLSSSRDSSLTRGAATFSGGRAHPSVTVGSVSVTEGTDWSVASTATGTVVNIANAIGAASGITVSTATTLYTTSGTITLTSLTVGTNTLYRLSTTATSGISKTGAAMTGGQDTAINSSAITATAHGIYTGMQVLYSTGSNFAITGLTNQTTYYAIRIDADHLYLSDTSTGSYAGTRLTITDTSLAGPHSFTLTPLSLSGNTVLQWQASVDGVNYANLSLSAMTLSSPFATASTVWDFTQVNYKYIRASVAGPSRGGVNLNIRAFGKRYGNNPL